MLFKEKQIKIESGLERHKELFNKVIDDTVAKLETNCYIIGEGKTADVKINKESSSICLKTVDYQKARKNKVVLSNKVDEEIDWLDKLSDTEFLKSIDINKRIVPRPLFSRNDSQYGFLFMERIKGMTFEDLFKNNLFDKLPKNLDWQVYFKKLEDIVGKLNKNKMFHRDLNEGNIFIDEDAEPMLIDFGSAYESFLSDEDPYRIELPNGDIRKVTSDDECLQKIKAKVL